MWHSGMEAFFGWFLVVLMYTAIANWLYEVLRQIVLLCQYLVQFDKWRDHEQLAFREVVNERRWWFFVWTVVTFFFVWIVRNFV